MNKPTELLDVVALTCDLPDKGLVAAQVGTVVELHGSGVYEVEFADDDGRTYAMATVPAERLLVPRYEPAGPVAA
jgi:hypothetical protein